MSCLSHTHLSHTHLTHTHLSHTHREQTGKGSKLFGSDGSSELSDNDPALVAVRGRRGEPRGKGGYNTDEEIEEEKRSRRESSGGGSKRKGCASPGAAPTLKEGQNVLSNNLLLCPRCFDHLVSFVCCFLVRLLVACMERGCERVRVGGSEGEKQGSEGERGRGCEGARERGLEGEREGSVGARGRGLEGERESGRER